ncbi:MAG: PrpF domain-containing protein, partial [Pseudomonadales bacterium]
KDVAGSTCGSLMPTAKPVENIAGIAVTCIDNGMPVVMMRAGDFGKSGYETPAELEADEALKAQIETIRLEVGPMMNLGDVEHKTVPKMTLLAPARKGGTISTRTFIPHRVHEAVGVLGAASVAAACLLPGSVANGFSRFSGGSGSHHLEVEHPTGSFVVELDISTNDDEFLVTRTALLRTARKLMQGSVFVPASILSQ